MGKRAIVTAVGGTVAAVAVAATLAFAIPAAAGPVSGQAVAVGQAAVAGAKATDCDRLKKVQSKREALETTLQGDANTKGSIAWLTAKAAAATTAGDANLAKLYTDRAALRSQVLDPLKTVDADRAAVIAANCS
jgi:hypothetical protein